MRILVATDQLFPDLKGGVARVATDTAEELARRGHDVTVLAPRAADPLPPGAADVRRVLPRTRLPRTATDVVGTRRHAAALRGEAFDVAVAHASTCAVGLLAAHLRAPLVYVFHSPTARELHDLRPRLSLVPDRIASYGLVPALRACERVAAAQARRVIVLSEFSRNLLLDEHPGAAGRTRAAGGAVDTNRFAPDDARASREHVGWPDDVPLLVTARRLEPRMGIDSLIDAIALLDGSCRPGLAIVGSGSLEAALRQRAAARGVADRVRFVGRVEDDELVEWYRAADLFVLPTLAFEGFGLVTAEALATGTPVVGTPVGATPELLAPIDRRLIAAGTDPAALAAAIANGLELTGPELRRRCRAHALDRFSWTRAIGAWEDVLEDACSATGA